MRTRPDVTQDIILASGKVTVDEAGFLTDPEAWSGEFAQYIADQENIELTGLHWDVLAFMREFYEENRVAADARFVFKYLGTMFDTDKEGAKDKLFEMFPYGYVKQAVKMAGMRQPRAWSTG